MNIFIETLSLYSRERSEEIYRVADNSMLPKGMKVDDIGFTGCQTNEAPTKYIIWSLAQENQVLDRIFIINTKETIGFELPHIGITTYAYYCKSIIDYIDELSRENDFLNEYLKTHYANYNADLYHSSAEAYYYDVTRSKVISENRSPAEWKELTDSIFEDDNIDLYFDFTGGSRISSLISMFTLRIAEIKDAKLKQVIYSDITTAPPRIVDCTNTYKILYEIEHVEKAQGTEKQVTIEHEVGHRLGWVSDEETRNTQFYDQALSESTTSIKKKSQEDIVRLEKTVAEDIQSSSGFSRKSKDSSLENTKKNNKKSAFLTLLNKVGTDSSINAINRISTSKIEDLIVRFYEEVIDAFCEINVMQYHAQNLNIAKNRKDSIVSVIKANADYYSKSIVNKRNQVKKYGLISIVQGWMKDLLKDSTKDPVSVMNAHCKITDSVYQGHLDRYKKVVGFSKELTEEFIEYLKSQDVFDRCPTDIDGSRKYLLDNYVEIVSLQQKYYNYGFPYRFVCQGVLLPQVEKYYYDSVERLMRDLSELRRKNTYDYRQRLKKLAYNDEMIESVIPILTEVEEVWTVDYSVLPDNEKDAFIPTLSARMEKVRLYRNAIAHKANPRDNPFRERDRQNEIVKLIIEWLIEYDEKFN